MQILDYGTHFLVRMERDYFFNRNLQAIKDLPAEGRKWWRDKNAWWVTGALREQVHQLQFSHKAKLVNPTTATAEDIGEIEPLPELTSAPAIKDVELRPYQTNGVAQGMNLRRYMNGDEQGLGKTLQTIATIATLAKEGKDVFPAVIICPASLKENWRREIEKFTDHQAMVLNDKNKNSWMRYYDVGYAQFFITNYESIKKYFVTSMPTKARYKSIEIGLSPLADTIKTIIIDESHKCKDSTRQQTKLCLRLAHKRNNVILLSGTPVVNKPIDLWPQLCIMGHSQIFGPTEKDYKDRFCDGGYGSSNLKALNYLLNKHCYFRREKKDVAKDLPSKDRQKILCEITNREEYNQAQEEFMNWLLAQDYDDEKLASALRGQALVKMNVLRQISSRGKIEQAKEFIDEVLDAGEKLIVFCNLKAIIASLKAIYPNAVTITGDDDTIARQRHIDAFQTDSKTQLILCNIKAAGVGITLTASSRVLFIEFPWTYADCVQCEDRAHRIGQVWPVMCSYLLGIDTIDEKMLDTILTKKDLAQGVTGSTDNMEMSTVDKIINLFNQKNKN
jgi:SWI/SNF-related matrix-associated actin-dependent regulator of chromatin subfamily A-like protein 1